MKKSMKIFSLILCLALVLTIFAACGKTEKKEDETKASTTESTTVETTTEAPKGDATHDGRLIGLWTGAIDFPMDENGTTAKVNVTMELNEDGTCSMTMNEDDLKAMIISLYMVMFECETEEELDAALQQNMGMSLDDFVAMAMEDFSEDDLNSKGVWTTKDGKLYITDEDVEATEEEACAYEFSEDGKTVTLTFEDEDMGTQIIVLKKA